MKYSILMPYHKRSQLLHNTLVSFRHFYNKRNDWEVLIGVDEKSWSDSNESNALNKVLENFKDLNVKRFDVKGFPNTYNPAAAYNLLANNARGTHLVLTNPECLHYVDVLGGAEKLQSKTPQDIYIVCACENTLEGSYKVPISKLSEFTYKHCSWYQHLKFRNGLYHFCSIISKKNYFKIGGFDEEYMKGIAYDDDDFRDKAIWHKIPILVTDSLLTIHQGHGPDLSNKAPNGKELLQKNRSYYYQQAMWRKNNSPN